MPIPDNYDFSDPAVRELVDSNHCPCEETDVVASGLGISTAITLRCSKCHEMWPCTIIQARRAWTS